MDELVAMFRQRGDRYIDQCDALYAFLIEPFLVFKEPMPEQSRECPPPSFMTRSESGKCEEQLPRDLFDM